MSGGPTQRPDQAAIDALAPRLVELAGSPEESAEKAEVRAWAMANVAGLAGLPVMQLPFTSVAAHILASFGKINEAFVLAVASVRQHGLDRLCVDAIARVREGMLRGAFDAVFAKRPDLAKAQLSFMIERLGDVIDLIDERAGLRLLSEIEQIAAARSGLRGLDGRPTLIKLGVWGDAFIESAARNVLSTCLAPGNVPALRSFGPLIFHLHTRERHVDQLRALPAMRELARHAEIKIDLVPETFFIPTHMWGMGFWNRSILAMIEYDSLMYARQIGADMICLGADMVLSDGCLTAAKEKLAAGYDMFLMMPALRMIEDKASLVLQRHRQGAALTIPAEDLYRLSLEALHPVMLLQFMRRTPQRFPADPHQFFFTSARGFSAHTFQWHPLAFSARVVPENIGFDGQTIDCRFPSDLLVGKDRARASYVYQHPPSHGYLATVDNSQSVAAFGNFEMSPAGVVRSIDKWINRAEDFGHFAWALRQRTQFVVPPDLRLELPADCCDEDSAIEGIVAGMEGLRPEISRRIARYAAA
ncbi:MAG TPA: hypothetical protein VMH36_26555 [Alphaproteobacteria bacterium]|nr:hypothetical protein [Alphaproteobacteria bacterium]